MAEPPDGEWGEEIMAMCQTNINILREIPN
jgi:hypothetical protein